MKILAIDPGPEQSAFVFWDTTKNDFFGTRIGLWPNDDFFRTGFHGMDFVAIEMIQSYGMGVGRSTFQTCLIVGQMIQHFKGCKIRLYGRPAIKGQIGGRNDAEIRRALRIRHGDAKKGCKLEGVKRDIWAALALAVALAENPDLKEW